ncbi:rod shape-determining protein MreD [Legionella dresdenensis]|uniref:Rod shape-determining protein MreD n=1 Tax=Legionella dresdenensis TaxID=450200 RepID=A0ABV8CHB1_9GAMM
MNSLSIRLLISLLLALALTILPMPEILVMIRPAWVLLTVLYIQYYLPERFNIAILFVLGLVMDVLLATVMGEHAFALSIASWLASSKARRFRLFSISQQMGLIGVFCFLYQVIILTIDGFLGFHASFFSAIGCALSSVMLWPWIRLIAEDLILPQAYYQK